MAMPHPAAPAAPPDSDVAMWANRIVSYDPAVQPDQLTAHPLNARRHPGRQREALRESLGRVGWVDVVKVNTRTGNVVDGHARVEEALTTGDPVPVLYVDLDPDEERFVLATLDPISAMAEYDAEVLTDLMDGLTVTSDSLASMLGKLTDGALADLDPTGDAMHLGELDGLRDGDQLEPAGDDEQDDPDAGPTGDALAALDDVTIDYDPRYQVERGQVWDLGRHTLVCADVMAQHDQWAPLLEGHDLFVPYPGVFAALTEKASRMALLLVQPNPGLASHLVDKYARVRGDDQVARR